VANNLHRESLLLLNQEVPSKNLSKLPKESSCSADEEEEDEEEDDDDYDDGF
jgi:hypothetical protein